MNVLSEADAVGSEHSSVLSEDGTQWLDSLRNRTSVLVQREPDLLGAIIMIVTAPALHRLWQTKDNFVVALQIFSTVVPLLF